MQPLGGQMELPLMLCQKERRYLYVYIYIILQIAPEALILRVTRATEEETPPRTICGQWLVSNPGTWKLLVAAVFLLTNPNFVVQMLSLGFISH